MGITLVPRSDFDSALFALFTLGANKVLLVVIVTFPIEKYISTVVAFCSYGSSTFVVFVCTVSITHGATKRTCIWTRMEKDISISFVARSTNE